MLDFQLAVFICGKILVFIMDTSVNTCFLRDAVLPLLFFLTGSQHILKKVLTSSYTHHLPLETWPSDVLLDCGSITKERYRFLEQEEIAHLCGYVCTCVQSWVCMLQCVCVGVLLQLCLKKKNTR